MADNNLTEEANQEIEVLQSIYPEDITIQPNGRLIYNLPYNKEWSLHISLSSKYPHNDCPNILMLDCDSPDSDNQIKEMKKFLLEKCNCLLKDTYTEGLECLYDFTFSLNENWDAYLKEWLDSVDSKNNLETSSNDEISEIEERVKKISLSLRNDDPLHGWIQSEPIEDRGSIFIAYAYGTSDAEEALIRLMHLKTDNRLSRSRHVMFAYRLNPNNTGIIISDCDDDGETAAGSRMLHLLTLMDAQNVIVACARWFTGTHIGPDRFKHINTTTRDAILKGNFSNKQPHITSSPTVKKNNTNKKKKL